MVRGGVAKRFLLRMVGFKNDPEAVKQACTRLKTTGGGGFGPPPRPRNLQRQCSHGWFQKHSYAVKEAYTSGGLGGAALPVCKHAARMVNGGVQKDSN